jgi:type I restriction enzyme S subunit
MNPELILAHFERLSDAPDAVPRLRRFILDLAVRGKLVKPDPADEPVSELLRRIRAEKALLVEQGKIQKQKPQPPIEPNEIRFGLPFNWSWIRLNEITSYIQRGKSPKYASGDGLPVISQKCVQWRGLDLESVKKITRESIAAYEDVRFLREDDLLWNSTGTGTIGRVVRVVAPPSKLVCDSHVTVVRCLIVDAEYVRSWLRSDNVYRVIEDRAAGSTNQVELTSQMAINQVVPLPPLAEQRRIVAKLDELMALCDRLEAEQRERDVRRNRLAAAALHQLNNDSSLEATRRHANFYINHLPTITILPEQIPALREAIFNLAVRGRIVHQDGADEPVSKLLERIHAEQQRLINAGTIPKSKVRPQDASAELAFEPPKSWEPVAFGQLCNIVTSGSRGWAEYYSESGPKFIRAQNIRFGKLRHDDLACVNPPKRSEGTRTQVSKGDLLVVITGAGVTNPALLETDLGEAYVSQHVALIKPTDTNLSPWLLLCLMAPMGGRSELVTRAYGAGKPGLNLDNIRSLPIPLPSLAEQCRIVEKVNVLMDVCDQLEAQLVATRIEGQRLLEAVLHDVLMLPQADSQTTEPHVLGSGFSPAARKPAFIT